MYLSRSIPAEQWKYCILFLLFGRDIYLAFLLGDYGSHYGIVLAFNYRKKHLYLSKQGLANYIN